MVPKMLKFVGVVVVLWFVVLCYLGPTMFQLMEESRRASSELNRINKAIEHLQDSNAKLRRGIVDGDSMIHKDTAGTLYIYIFSSKHNVYSGYQTEIYRNNKQM